MAKNILIYSDGTGQAGGLRPEERRSNIYKLYRATRVGPDSCIDPAEQVAYYDAGLGSRPPSGGTFSTAFRRAHNFVSQATGFGLTTNIIDCYEVIVRLWRPGDRIFLFGFSRGAYTVRALGGVLALCGVPTRLENGAPMGYDSGTARRLAKIAVKRVYQHTASKAPDTASERERELLEQRHELARRFRETYGVDLSDKSHYPFFIGVFDTVASIANKGALVLLAIGIIVVAAAIGTLLWRFHPDYSPWFGNVLGNLFSWLFGLFDLETARWSHWLYLVVGVFAAVTFGWYLKEQVKFAPSADPEKWWRTLNMTFGRLSFEDTSLNDNVAYARHAISIDENRAAFPRVGWGDPNAKRPDKDAQGIATFQQYWFAGNHSDIGGSYPENESRLSDIALGWMVDAAAGIDGGIEVDRSVLRLYPACDGLQHDQRRAGFPILTRWLRLTWKKKLRAIPDPDTTLHESVYERMELPGVLQYDRILPYRPEALRKHAKLARYYGDVPAPGRRSGLAGLLADSLADC